MATDWAAFRSHFPVTARWAYLDHAAVAPLPDAAAAAFGRYAAHFAAHAAADYLPWLAELAEVRRRAAALINAPSADDVAFAPSTTTAIGWVAEGFRWSPGDAVVVAADEYPSNRYPWMNLREKGVEVRVVPGRDGRVDPADVAAAVTPSTRLLSASFVQFATGFRADLDALADVCRARGLFFFVDAIQGLGAFPLDVQKTPVDALAADGHKWLLGPEGAGLFYVRRESLGRLRPMNVGAHSMADPYAYGDVRWDPKPHAGRYEGGAVNVAGLAALGESLKLLLDAGVESVARRVLELTDRLCDRAQADGWRVFSSRRPGEASGIVSLTKDGVDPAGVVRRCRAAGVAVNARVGRVRVSPHAYNTPDDLDRFLEAAR